MNIIKSKACVGDIAIIVNGEYRFVNGSECTKAFIESQQCLGVVYYVQGKFVRVVAGVNNQAKQWSCVADYKITSIPSASQSCAVTLNNTSIGTFEYTKDTGTIEEFATQLNAWLREIESTVALAKKWEAYTWNGNSYLQQSTYDQYEDTVTITGCGLSKLIGTEVSMYDNSRNMNQIKQVTIYNGMCNDRLYDYCYDSGSNPVPNVLNGTTQLFYDWQFPCRQSYYDSSFGIHLRENFPSYEEYLNACMIRERELNKSSVQFRDGKLYTSLLKDKKVLRWGNEVYAYPAARYCYDYDCGVEGFGPGTFWLPSLYELCLLMRPINNVYNSTTWSTDYIDLVNTALSKNSKWSLISSSAPRWSSSRYSSNHAWYFNSSGISLNSYFYGSFTCSPVLAFTTA